MQPIHTRALTRPTSWRDIHAKTDEECLAMMELHVCTRDGKLLRAFALGDRDETIIGREEHCDVRIMSPSVSREHCSIEHENGALVLRDLGSTSGTIVNGKRIERMRIESGLQVIIGPALLRFVEDQ